MAYLGFDTSNYTTSAALYFPEENRIVHRKMLLPVKSGEKGLRQSDAVFHHTVQLNKVCEGLFADTDVNISAVGASAYPRSIEGSYMPCFLVGVNTAKTVSSVCKVNFHTTSHQNGHILAALYSCGKLDLIKEPFIAFHLSGGTTEVLFVEPDANEIIKCRLIASSLDLKAGQAIDRVGVMLGMGFPCGAELDALSRKSNKTFRIRPTSKGLDISLSGVENKCMKMFSENYPKEDIARYCIEHISASLDKMTQGIIEKYGSIPLVYSGGVMSNSIIRKRFEEYYGGYFAEPEFSSDNAAGVAILTYFKENKK